MRVIFENKFHNTTATTIIPRLPYTLTANQYKRLRKKLCGMAECKCFGGHQIVQAKTADGNRVHWEITPCWCFDYINLDLFYHSYETLALLSG